VGVGLAHPGVPVVCIVGDGAMMFGVQAIWTAAQNNVPVVYVVLNNGQYGILKAFAEFQRTPGVPGLDLPRLDIPQIARGFGADARRVTSPDDALPAFQSAFDLAMARQMPVLVDVTVSPEIGDLFGGPVG